MSHPIPIISECLPGVILSVMPKASPQGFPLAVEGVFNFADIGLKYCSVTNMLLYLHKVTDAPYRGRWLDNVT